MKSLLLRLILVASASPLIFAGFQAASALSSDPAPVHQFLNLDAPPMWTEAPVRVDTISQAYERMPAAVSVASAEIKAVPKAITTASSEKTIAIEPVEAAASEEMATAVQWCQQRYSSYDVADGTYQPFGGGSRRKCNPPAAATNLAMAAAGSQSTASANEPAHRSWCENRYSSYRAADDTYQPFSGGRRRCSSPYATSNELASEQQASVQ